MSAWAMPAQQLKEYDGTGGLLAFESWCADESLYANVHSVPDERRVAVAAYALKGNAKDWYLANALAYEIDIRKSGGRSDRLAFLKSSTDIHEFMEALQKGMGIYSRAWEATKLLDRMKFNTLNGNFVSFAYKFRILSEIAEMSEGLQWHTFVTKFWDAFQAQLVLDPLYMEVLGGGHDRSAQARRQRFEEFTRIVSDKLEAFRAQEKLRRRSDGSGGSQGGGRRGGRGDRGKKGDAKSPHVQ
uniref:Retrotransposon gag domain-containing protein n=2 Tax=Phaeomonas parva TaxID=124430 RepID=A0A7S1UJX7_9STRA|mmetsp:Transcript_7367/g.21461  ORF Transcript_7367/g.21461 Transcript_7367/m.21461 type:complete len:243 (+) Transcript_7367:162-890(+)|eukprot:CAMPEP_0118883286 /NCGR_PEP_ID=MMETSP1163-20130328/22359_1 /TAXON_ID=124430 /ORGANISM="Phaeomonas parva, Strain CCMP2877" /LENGTH=242 /DNA_ID=CAMNT_0006820635 /DNA_START=123 /DNA_END=851 /DNA_ORIENTATION=+